VKRIISVQKNCVLYKKLEVGTNKNKNAEVATFKGGQYINGARNLCTICT